MYALQIRVRINKHAEKEQNKYYVLHTYYTYVMILRDKSMYSFTRDYLSSFVLLLIN